jgi:double-stranded uracil-DNA glycosylase
MAILDGFAPIAAKNAQVLILGTMPGAASLAKQQYYGHPRNAFWPIMAALFSIDTSLDYLERRQQLIESRVAVWDVLQGCKRQGSLDAQIELTSIKINPFDDFFHEYLNIKHVYFNGAMAEKLFQRHCLAKLSNRFTYLYYQRLPSTSPAYASLNLSQKIAAWKIIKQSMLK